MERTLTLGSLFDGSGGFPLAGSLCGIKPVWASEVEPYPIAVTKSRFPHIKHLGDISKINGAEIEPVDIITFGSPCQDLSVAGKRAGIKHESSGDEETTRSGLFMEAVRIIKEMRKATDGAYPTFALWENVPGAYSSNKGEDFRIVLEELIKIVEPGAVMPPVPKNGWPYADHYCGDGWSLAYRTFDAQHWGVPQRRRRIHLIVDFRGERAGQVSFEREGLRGYFETSSSPRQSLAGDAENCSGTADSCNDGGRIDSCGLRGDGVIPYTLKRGQAERGWVGDVAPTLKASHYKFPPSVAVPCVMEAAGFKAGQSMAGGMGWQEEKAATLSAQCSGTEPTVCIKEQHLFENHSQDTRYKGPLDVCPMLPAQLGTGGNNQPFVVEETKDVVPVCCLDGDKIGKAERAGGSGLGIRPGDKMYTLTAKDVHGVCIPINDKATRWKGGGASWNQDGSGNGLGVGQDGDPAPTLTAGDRHAVAFAMQGFGDYKESEVASGMKARDYKDATDLVTEVAGVDCRNMNEYPELYPTLQAKPNGGQSLNFSGAVRVRYIVRRLTPTECARLQGFADRWGDIDHKESLTPEEYKFWHVVRNTHAAINGKKIQTYTQAQMLTWYNKLHTDSAEYKMWGNGIALPPALYCMQGIVDAFAREHHEAEQAPSGIPGVIAYLETLYEKYDNNQQISDIDVAQAIEMLRRIG